MPLYRTGEGLSTLHGLSYPAKDHADLAVTVSISHEAIQDYELDSAWAAASRKYDSGNFGHENGRPIVRVTTADI